MLPIRTPDHRLARYRATDNLTRSKTLVRSRRIVRPLDVRVGLSVVVLNLDRPELIVPLTQLMDETAGFFAHHNAGFQLIIGDTGSSDPAVSELYADLPACAVLVPNLKFHYSRSNNDTADGRVRFHRVLFLNNDVAFASPEQIWNLYQVSLRPGIGIVGLALDYPGGAVQHLGIDIIRQGDSRGLIFHPGIDEPARHHPGRVWPSLAVTGACLVIRTDLWQQLSGFDEVYTTECQDIDLCLAARRSGFHVVVADVGPVVHLENATRDPGEECWPDRRLLLRRWESYLEASIL